MPDHRTQINRAVKSARRKERLEEVVFALYERFRPRIPEGARGWGARGTLDLDDVRSMAAGAR